MDVPSLLIAFLGGVLPALAWLWFWLREDTRCPEPRSLIALAFFAGIGSVLLAIPLEHAAASILAGNATIVAWAVIEEIGKFALAAVLVLRRSAVNEPIDYMIYMITVALGFAALENSLFIFSAMQNGSFIETVMTGNLRFVGATLLHVLASATVGIGFALSFYRSLRVKFIFVVLSLILASVLHAVFNLLIITSNGTHLLTTFALVWAGIIALIFMFEYVKGMRRRTNEHATTYVEK